MITSVNELTSLANKFSGVGGNGKEMTNDYFARWQHTNSESTGLYRKSYVVICSVTCDTAIEMVVSRGLSYD